MSDARDVIAVAREILTQHGGDAAALIDRRAQENIRAGDSGAATFWSRVAQAIRALDTKPERPAPLCMAAVPR